MTARLYGKLPAHGDFVSRGFTHAQAQACDRWLATSLAAARAVHGAAFEARHDHAPPWRYADPRTGGALALSQDAARRRFPIFLDVATTAPLAAAAAIEKLLYEAITGRWTADMLVAAAEALALADEEAAPEARRWWTEGADFELSGAQPAELLTWMLAVEVAA